MLFNSAQLLIDCKKCIAMSDFTTLKLKDIIVVSDTAEMGLAKKMVTPMGRGVKLAPAITNNNCKITAKRLNQVRHIGFC
jgi:hypothetical protein